MPRIIKICILLCAFSFALTLLSCNKKELKSVPQESSLAADSFVLAETIRTAFANRDTEKLKESATENGFTQITKELGMFDSVESSFTPRWVELDQQTLHLYLSWKNSWQRGKERIDDRGMAVFVFTTAPLKLDQILRANPFSLPER